MNKKSVNFGPQAGGGQEGEANNNTWWEKIFLTFSKYVKLLQRIFLILRRHRKSGNALHAGVWKTPSTMSPPTIDRVPQTGEPAENVLMGVPPTVRYYDIRILKTMIQTNFCVQTTVSIFGLFLLISKRKVS